MAIVLANVVALSFDRDLAFQYTLQFTTDLAEPVNWMDSGFSSFGSGDRLSAYDPTGFSTQNTCRVLASTP